MIELVIEARHRDLGSFTVMRVLPYAERRMVGPFIFFDHMGRHVLPAGLPKDADVRPHPHIGIATVTYLFEGELTHRDSTGAVQYIRPGDVNWMVAGRGVSHSERFDTMRARGAAPCTAFRHGWRCQRQTRNVSHHLSIMPPTACHSMKPVALRRG